MLTGVVSQIDYQNTENLKAEAEEGARMGFAGKQVIHPSQVSHMFNRNLSGQQGGLLSVCSQQMCCYMTVYGIAGERRA